MKSAHLVLLFAGLAMATALTPFQADAGRWRSRYVTSYGNVPPSSGGYYYYSDSTYLNPMWYGYGASWPGTTGHYPDASYFSPVQYGYGASLPGSSTRAYRGGSYYFNPLWYGYGASLPSSYPHR
jgi:hypothetical protein